MPRVDDLNSNKKNFVDWQNLKKDVKGVSDPKAQKLFRALFKIILGEEGDK